jgi:hypothetical protein
MTVDIFGSLCLLLMALLNVGTLIVVRRTSKNMSVLEKNTNSKMDALIVSTAKASRAEGDAEGLERGRNEPKR